MAWVRSNSRRLVVDVDEDQDAFDGLAMVEVDVDRLAGRRPEPVVAAELDVRRGVHVAEEPTERLHDPLRAVHQLIQAAEVQVDVDHALAVPEHLRRLERLEGCRSRLSRWEPPMSEVRIRQARLMRRCPVAASCLVSET